ncbi:MAG: SAM-dependent methyltransferase [Acidimicrobiia bacterium]|nr:SAM-dependent methyltransferase [Acidimicrobiia bacterium]MDH5518930.1 SAM-dependent methyltransferase [Acidimicrobiia bacterium]
MTPHGDRPTITICGLGPGAPDLLTQRTSAILAGPEPLFLRTSRHPGAERFAVDAISFDPIYDSADSFAEVYRTISEALVEAAVANGRVIYCVPGSPLVLERSVAQLRARHDVAIELVPAISFLDETWARLAVDPVEEGVRLIDGHRFAVEAAGDRGPLLVAHAHARWVLSDIKLALLEHDVGGDESVIVLQRLGTDEEAVFEVPIEDLDRRVDADHLTSLYLPTVGAPIGRALIGSVELMRRLRTECPWDAEQDHATLRKYLLEETYEVLDVLDRVAELGAELTADRPDAAASAAALSPVDPAADGDIDEALIDAFEQLEGELGDLWLQILFHSRLASEAGHFDVADVAATLTAKMISRHPHVFGTDDPDLSTRASDRTATAAGVEAQWNRIKASEGRRSSVLDGVPRAMPSLARAAKIVKRVAGAHGPPDRGPWAERLGLADDADADAASESDSESDTDTDADAGAATGQGDPLDPVIDDEADLGRVLLAVVEAARVSGLDAEQALRAATNALEESVRSHERLLGASVGATGTPRLSWVVG